ncbi:MAG: general secretion pathway protein GspB [Alteromonas macleodii]|uniref:general secretion pathway protein GspB n=1 Tax=Alteromonas TaxID=226 RepID=UPI00128658CA|nr:general secretion pathway protein GspB [Alteromonas macleodii]MDM7960593.1 general secretion pathway protein GspB [Alteromonas macleodii]MDM8169560.1 general secretion pathway protein GspB [Alteromonas macleodii]CAI3938653.1 type II secretion system protein B [Alteromonas macleodii]VTP53098.1 type II secretion system protein B [Alteromonas macleodii]
MSNIVAIDHLKPGMVIVQITKQNGPVKIRKSGLVTSDAMVQGLSEMGVQEVEIDPEQTVEIAPTVHHRTQTQALLRGEHDTTAKFDKSLNEQFNRSLFLPTVEGLPSAWKLYTKQVALFAVVILGGLCIGFSAAMAKRWWPMLTAPASVPVADSESSVSQVEASGGASALTTTQSSNEAPGTSSNKSEQVSSNTQESGQSAGLNETANTAVNANVSNGVAAQQGTQANAMVNNQSAGNLAATQNTDLGAVPNKNPITTGTQNRYNNDISQRSGAEPSSGYERSSSTDSRQTETSGNYEGKVLNEAASQSDVSVSPELMARFNAAVEALDSKAQDNTPAEAQARVKVKDELPRVDQLPVRLLTRLPTMNFSAHMYASRPADRWVRVNGRQIGEGDWIADRVQIVNIEAQRVVLAFEDEIFTMAALTDW